LIKVLVLLVCRKRPIVVLMTAYKLEYCTFNTRAGPTLPTLPWQSLPHGLPDGSELFSVTLGEREKGLVVIQGA
jgi:hypothetical protein